MDLLCLEAYVTLSQSQMTTLTIDISFVAKMQLISIRVQHQTVWSFQVKLYAQLRNVTFQLSLVYHSFNNGSYQWNLYVLVLTAVNSRTRFLLLFVCVCVCVWCVCVCFQQQTWSSEASFLISAIAGWIDMLPVGCAGDVQMHT